MKKNMTFAIDATYDHDWLHFLVSAPSREDAKQIINQYFDWHDDTESIQRKLKEESFNYPAIIDFFYDEDDIRCATDYLRVSDAGSVSILVLDKDDMSYEYDTLEEAEEMLKTVLAELGPEYVAEKETYRGLRFVIIKKGFI